MGATPNYNLPTYESSDKPNLRDQYNGAMNKIDTELLKQAGDITTAQTAATNAATAAATAKTTADNAASAAAVAQTTANKGVSDAAAASTAAGNAQATANTAKTTADNANANFANYSTTVQSKQLFEPILGAGSSDILGCIGDSILAGWSNENPSGINAWDTYLGSALGYAPANVFKSTTGGAGFQSSPTFTSEVAGLRTAITAAGKNVNDVTLVVIGGGVNDVRNNSTHAQVKAGATGVVNAVASAFPNARICVFPMIIGTRGCNSTLLDLEQAVLEGINAANSSALKRTTGHTGVWTWNYDGNDAGVSSDRLHLLAAGEQRVGQSMSVEIRGGSAYRSAYKVDITNAQGASIAGGYRRDSMFSFDCATNLTSISTGGKNRAIGVDARYMKEGQCATFGDANQTNFTIMFGDLAAATFNSYQPITNKACYGSTAYAIESSLGV